jgi:hypothetical protein
LIVSAARLRDGEARGPSQPLTIAHIHAQSELVLYRGKHHDILLYMPPPCVSPLPVTGCYCMWVRVKMDMALGPTAIEMLRNQCFSSSSQILYPHVGAYLEEINF